MKKLTFGSLFAGIGGFDLGLERAGLVCKWQVEIDPFCQRVLQKHWPDVPRYGDIRDVGSKELEPVDVITGGFPCQPFSEAGEQRGEQDDRNLWPEMRRVIDELRPAWVIAENMPGIRNLYLDTILSDLESLDYTAGTLDLPAVAFGAPHIRHRLFIIAHTQGEQMGTSRQSWQCGGVASVANANSQQKRYGYIGTGAIFGDRVKKDEIKRQTISNAKQWYVEPDVGRMANGVPDRMDRLRALGNAVVPQVAEWIGRRLFDIPQEV